MNSFENMPDHARVWIYVSDRELSQEEAAHAREETRRFVQQWSAHGSSLLAAGDLIHQRFLILAVDESQAGASGCSIDSSVHFVQKLGTELGVDFFNRMLAQYETDGRIAQVRLNELWAMRKAGVVTDQTIVYNNLVKDLGEWRKQWRSPFSDSWHATMWS
jgi:hypothetical protein